MLANREYMGHTVNFRSFKKSYRGKRVKNDRSDGLTGSSGQVICSGTEQKGRTKRKRYNGYFAKRRRVNIPLGRKHEDQERYSRPLLPTEP